MIRVLLVDDEALIREGLRLILDSESDIEVVGEAADGTGATLEAGRLRPDVILMDIRMPKTDGIEATRHLAQDPRARGRVVALTTFDRDEYVYQALRAGASGFLLKNAPATSLVEAVRTVARGEALLAPQITRRLIEQFVQQPSPGDDVPEQLTELTDRELEVLRLIARGHSNDEIAQQLFLSYATVKSYVTRILSKLDLRDRTTAVVLAYETGLVKPGQTDT
jgi:DNA-binding NarL/FixJ family response regulator